jgi:hypothetical protein
MPFLGDPEPGDGVCGFPRSLAHTIEPRAPIGKLGFTESYPLLEIGENVQERVSMHAAQCRMMPISGGYKERAARAEKLAAMPERTAPGRNS